MNNRLGAAILVGIGIGFARIAGSQSFTEFPIPTPDSAPANIAAGPDGDLYFTEYDGNRIGRISTTGIITDYLCIL